LQWGSERIVVIKPKEGCQGVKGKRERVKIFWSIPFACSALGNGARSDPSFGIDNPQTLTSGIRYTHKLFLSLYRVYLHHRFFISSVYRMIFTLFTVEVKGWIHIPMVLDIV
jgi:hypothetical protein